MGLLEDAQSALDKGVSKARGAVSTVAGEHFGFVRTFARLCTDGAAEGFHERNGGNASYRLTWDDVSSLRPYFYVQPSSWVALESPVPALGGEFVLVTGSGVHLRNVASDVARATGVVELSAAGDAWRLQWGLAGGGLPTSELGAHLSAHEVRTSVTNGSCRVLYHAHPAALVALSALVPADARTLTRLLWGSFTESVVAIPQGVGALVWEVPGSSALARATTEALASFPACVWQLHGVFASGDSCDEAFGLVCALEKAADVYLRARTANAGRPDLPFSLDDAAIRATAQAYGLPLNEAFLRA